MQRTLAKSVLLLSCACGSRSGLPERGLSDASASGGTGGAEPASECPGPPGSVRVLDSGYMQPASLALTKAGIVWGEWHFNARIALTPFAGGASVTLSEGEASPNAMASDGSEVYFSVQGYGEKDGALRRVSASGTPKVVLPGLSRPKGVALRGNEVFSTSGATASAKGSIIRTTKKGGVPSSVAQGLAVPFAVAANEDGVFFTDLGTTSTLYRAGDPPIPLSGGSLAFTRIAVHAGSVYAVRHQGDLDVLFSVPTAGGFETELAATSQEISDVTVDDAGVFWLTRSRPGDPPAGTLWFSPHGGSLVSVAQGSWRPSQLEVDARSAYLVYFQPDGSGGVLQICRPDVPVE